MISKRRSYRFESSGKKGMPCGFIGDTLTLPRRQSTGSREVVCPDVLAVSSWRSNTVASRDVGMSISQGVASVEKAKEKKERRL